MIAFTWLNAREAVNIGLLLSDLCLVFVLFWQVLLPEIRTPGWLNYKYNKLALGAGFYFLGMTFVRTWGAFLLHGMRTGVNPLVVESTYPVNLAGSFLAFLGALYLIYVFSPQKSAKKAGIFVTALVVLSMGITYILA